MSLCVQGSAAELRANVPSSPFPCRAVLLKTLQFSPNPLLAMPLSCCGAGREHPREPSRCLDGAWCLPGVWSVGRPGAAKPSPTAMEGPILQPRMRKCPVAQLPSIRLFALFSRSAELHVGKSFLGSVPTSCKGLQTRGFESPPEASALLSRFQGEMKAAGTGPVEQPMPG